MSDDEIQRIKEKASDKRLEETAKIALALVYTGMRINKLLQFKKENLHLEYGYVAGGEKTKAERDHCIPIHVDVLPYFHKWSTKSKM